MAELRQPSTGNPSSGSSGGVPWERELVERLALSALIEQRRARRWGIFFKLLLAVYLVALLALSWPGLKEASSLVTDHTALVDIDGVISEHARGSAKTVIRGLRAAFEDKKAKGVIVRINSPGGSPVQAGYIYDEIKRLKGKHPDTPVYAVITDMCASGGYYVAAAADKIYADPSSIVGSIGVRMDSFGFVAAMDKLGIERRLLTAGEHKGILDPFSPTKPEEVAHVEQLLADIHAKFIERVKGGRGDRLASDAQIFSGLIWTGAQGKELGLVDELASADHVAREVFGAEKIVNYTKKPDYLERLAERFGVALGRALSLGLTSTALTIE
jgi:protease-4